MDKAMKEYLLTLVKRDIEQLKRDFKNEHRDWDVRTVESKTNELEDKVVVREKLKNM